MSDRTQIDGRTMYTEHDYPFQTRPVENIFQQNNRWLDELDRYIRIGDPTFDANAKHDSTNGESKGSKIILYTNTNLYTRKKGDELQWAVAGYIENYSRDNSYSNIKIDISGFQSVTTQLLPNGSFGYIATMNAVEDIGSLDLTISATSSSRGHTIPLTPAKTVIDFESTDSTPTIVINQNVKFAATPGTFTNIEPGVTMFDGQVAVPEGAVPELYILLNDTTKIPILVFSNGEWSYVADNNMFREGLNDVLFCTKYSIDGVDYPMAYYHKYVEGVRVLGLVDDLPETTEVPLGADSDTVGDTQPSVPCTCTLIPIKGYEQDIQAAFVMINDTSHIGKITQDKKSVHFDIPYSMLVKGENAVKFFITASTTNGVEVPYYNIVSPHKITGV